MVLQPFKNLLLGIVRLFRRMLCCFSFGRRNRKPSATEPMEIRVVVDGKSQNGRPQMEGNAHIYPPKYQYATAKGQEHPERDWNSWDDSPRTVSKHIEQYRQRIAKPPTPPPEEPEPDFFSELTPVIKPQLRYYLGEEKNEKVDFSRLEAKVDVPITMNADLEDWVDESINGGWEELDSEKTKQMIREKRKELRNQRNQRLAKPGGIDVQHNFQTTTATTIPQDNFRSYT